LKGGTVGGGRTVGGSPSSERGTNGERGIVGEKGLLKRKEGTLSCSAHRFNVQIQSTDKMTPPQNHAHCTHTDPLRNVFNSPQAQRSTKS
jgi:hypothetical protein